MLFRSVADSRDMGYGIWDMACEMKIDVSFTLSRACIHTYTQTHRQTPGMRIIDQEQSTAATSLPRNQLKVIVEIARQSVYSA